MASMSILPGNTSDSLRLQPNMKDIKESHGLGRLVVVADKGLNSSRKNITVRTRTKEIQTRKVLLYWSKSETELARRKRGEKALSAERIALALGAATCQV